MAPDHLLTQLDAHQAGITATITEARQLVAGDPAAAIAPLARARWTLARQLREYQVFKHHAIFGPATRRRGTPDAIRAEGMAASCVALGEAFQTYCKHWSGTDVAGRWTEYRPAMLSMTARISRALQDERQAVAALLGMR